MKSRVISPLLVALIFFTSVNLSCSGNEEVASQGDTLRLWKKSLILSSANYSYRGQEGDIGLVGSKIKKIVKDVPEALAEVQTFEDYRISSFLLTLTSGAGLGFGIVDLIDGDNTRGTILLTAGGSGLVTAIALDRVGYGHLKNGVRKFNEYVKVRKDTSEWEEEAIVYYPGSKSENVATNWSVYGTFLPIALGSFILIVQKTTSDVEPGVGVHLFFIVGGASIGPALGYFYCNAGNRGVLGIGIRTGLIILTAALSERENGSKSWQNFDIENEYLLIGSGILLAAIAYDIFKVNDAVRKYNRKFSDQSFRLVPKYFSESQAGGIELQFRF